MPDFPSLDRLRRAARRLLQAAQAGDAIALQRFDQAGLPLRLSSAQLLIAREQGQSSWPALVAAAERAQALGLAETDYTRRLLALAIGQGHEVPRPERLLELLRERPLAGPLPALLCGDLAALRGSLRGDVRQALGPWRVQPLVYVAASSLARLPAHAEGLRATAAWLLERGADPNARWQDPEFGHDLPVLYGAVARARSADLVACLLAAGAEPNDNESLYHATELQDRRVLQLLVEGGARWPGTNALFRQLDHDDAASLAQALSLGADPNESGPQGLRPLQHALQRGRDLNHLRLLLQHGADPALPDPRGHDAAWHAARCGDAAALALLRSLGLRGESTALEAFLAACAAADGAQARSLLQATPALMQELGHEGLVLLPDQAQRGRLASVRLMLELGWPVDVPGAWQASALNQAAFRGDAAMVELLLAHGARWHERNGYGGDALGSCLHAACNEPVPGGDYAAVFALLLADGAAPPDEVEELPEALQAVLLER